MSLTLLWSLDITVWHSGTKILFIHRKPQATSVPAVFRRSYYEQNMQRRWVRPIQSNDTLLRLYCLVKHSATNALKTVYYDIWDTYSFLFLCIWYTFYDIGLWDIHSFFHSVLSRDLLHKTTNAEQFWNAKGQRPRRSCLVWSPMPHKNQLVMTNSQHNMNSLSLQYNNT